MNDQDKTALRYAGFLGHTFASVRADGSSTSGEYTSLQSARRLASAGERIYRRSGKSWRYVETKESEAANA